MRLLILKPMSHPESDSESESEAIDDIMSGLKEQMQQICDASAKIDSQMIGLYERAKMEAVDWMQEPLRPRPAVKAWCIAHKVSETPTIDQFSDACFKAAMSLDYETRVLIFRHADADALWGGQQCITIYDMIAKIPTLFC